MKISSYCYPSQEDAKEYAAHVDNLQDQDIRRILKLIMCCGFRFGEVINSYLFYDADRNIFVRAPASKSRRINLLKERKTLGHYTTFIGRSKLLSYIRTNQNVFKSVPLVNLFNVDITEFEPLINEDMQNPKMFFADGLEVKSYSAAFKRLKKVVDEVKVKYRQHEDEASITRYYKPSFHFYRKLFASELNRAYNYNFLKTVDYMKWRNINIILQYVKDY